MRAKPFEVGDTVRMIERIPYHIAVGRLGVIEGVNPEKRRYLVLIGKRRYFLSEDVLRLVEPVEERE